MRETFLKWAILAAAACLPLVTGCESGTPSVDTTTAKATVKGKVTLYGKAATKGEVVFDPSNIERKDATAVSGKIGADGSYEVTTLAGRNRVTIRGAAPPPKSANSMSSALETEFTATAGENTFEVVLPKTQ